MPSKPKPITFDETAALDFDPFDGDTDNDGFSNRVVNEIVTMEEDRRCTVCQGEAATGTRARHIVDSTLASLDDASDLADVERSRQEHFICAACCKAALKDDDGVAFARLQDLGANRAQQAREKRRAA